MNFNFDRIGLLLHVVEKARDYPKLKALHDAAIAELEAHATGKTEERRFGPTINQADIEPKRVPLTPQPESPKTEPLNDGTVERRA